MVCRQHPSCGLHSTAYLFHVPLMNSSSNDASVAIHIIGDVPHVHCAEAQQEHVRRSEIGFNMPMQWVGIPGVSTVEWCFPGMYRFLFDTRFFAALRFPLKRHPKFQKCTPFCMYLPM